VPQVLASLPSALVTHGGDTSMYLAQGDYVGRDIAVIGAGQSALEAAALLHERGARVKILARRDVWWSDRFGPRPLIEKLKAPNSVMGPGRENWVLQHVPMLAYYLPDAVRVRFTRRHLGPFGAWWLRDRVDGKISILRQTSLVSAAEVDGKVRLTVRSEKGSNHELEFDHVISATGYETDVDRLSFLDNELRTRIHRIERAPRLSQNFESSVRGLYFVGPAGSFSFGPLVRFVAGATYTTPKVARHLARALRRTVSDRAAHGAVVAEVGSSY
jgi:thioredoxin reductase